jgi:hypothetical protein
MHRGHAADVIEEVSDRKTGVSPVTVHIEQSLAADAADL